MTETERFLPSPKSVALFAISGGSLLSVVGPFEALDIANRLRAARGRPPLYVLRGAGREGHIPHAHGLGLEVELSASLPSVHTLIVGGGPDLPERPVDPALLREVERLAKGAERIVSVCGGAFVLGELGLLDGRRCTTHWMWLELLRQRFPAAQVEPDAIYTEDGPIWTSAGVTAGIDLALQLVRTDGGSRLAHAVARMLVVFVQRPGGQTQFGSALRMRPATDDRLRDLVTAVLRDPGAQHDVETLAQRMAMSPRNFARTFKAQTGQTPAAFVARARIEAAQRALAGSDASIAEIAGDCGFGSEATLRRSFQRLVGVSPSDWRARFSQR